MTGKNTFVRIDLPRIVDRASFHAVFTEALGFPKFYGHNMDAWIDCMSSLDAPQDGMTQVHVEPGNVLVLQLDQVRDFRKRCPVLYDELIECAAFVNWRRIESGGPVLLALSFCS